MKYLIAVIFLCIPVSVLAETKHLNKNVEILHSGDVRDCFFFTLGGVSEADPIKAGNSWFAVEFSKISSQNMMSMLLAAKVSGAKLNVTTTGNAACDGLAEVKNIQLP